MAVAIPFNLDHNFEPGRVDVVSPLVRRVMAPNAGPFTFLGTNSYILGRGEVAIVDPGPAIEAHLDALLKAVAGETVTHILVTHTHTDHSPLAAPLKARTGAKTYAFGPHGSGKADLGVAVEEGGDRAFMPDVRLKDGERVHGRSFTVDAVYTPGHTSNHLCFALAEEAALITGDHVMSWSTSVVVPPDGDMADYMASLAKLRRRNDRVYYPAHGGPVSEPRPFVEAFIAHRENREQQIIDCLARGPAPISSLVERMYANVDKKLHPAAARSVHAHLIRMVADGRIAGPMGTPFEGTYRLP